MLDIRDSVARKSRVSADNQSGRLSDQSNTGGRLSAFTRTIAGILKNKLYLGSIITVTLLI